MPLWLLTAVMALTLWLCASVRWDVYSARVYGVLRVRAGVCNSETIEVFVESPVLARQRPSRCLPTSLTTMYTLC